MRFIQKDRAIINSWRCNRFSKVVISLKYPGVSRQWRYIRAVNYDFTYCMTLITTSFTDQSISVEINCVQQYNDSPRIHR